MIRRRSHALLRALLESSIVFARSSTFPLALHNGENAGGGGAPAGDPPPPPAGDPAAPPPPPAGDPPPPPPAGDPAAPPPPPDDKKKDPPAPPAGAPEKYELKLPENAALTADAIERTAASARSLGLSNEAAQKVLELANAEAVAQRDAFLAAHSPGDPAKNIPPGAEWVKQQDAWKAQASADPEIGGTPEQFNASIAAANKAFAQFATPGFKEHVWKSGLASHPEVVRVFARIGKAMGEGSVVQPGSGGGTPTRSAAEILYGGKKE